ASESQRELYTVVEKIPHGTVTSYGNVGKAITNPVSGLVAGRWMHVCPPELPWWRVVGADGTLKTYNLNPDVGHEQRKRLTEEDIEFDEEGRVKAEFFLPFEALL